MIVLGINDGHNGTACLLVDGKIAACISEERIVREKNIPGYPKNAIDECLAIAGLKPKDIDLAAHSFRELVDPMHWNSEYYMKRVKQGHTLKKKLMRMGAKTPVRESYFNKLRGKRVFLMAPIHHHFELKGWSETKVVVRFWIIAAMWALLSLGTLKVW